MALLVLTLRPTGPSWSAPSGDGSDSTSSVPVASAPLPPRERSPPVSPEPAPASSPESAPKTAMTIGTVRWFSAQKGYGYVQPDVGGDAVIFHMSAVETAGIGTLSAGQKLSFQVEQGLGGSVAAVNLHPLLGNSPSEKPPRSLPAEGSSRPPPNPLPKVAPRLPRSDTAARLLPTDPSRSAEPPYSPLSAQASNFISSYWEEVAGNDDRMFSYLSSIYSPVVTYYGKPTPKANVLQEKYNFVRRWPTRQTWPSPGAESPSISCNDAAAECEIAGVRDFAAANVERGAHSAGTVRYTYRVRFVDGSAQIEAEDSKVVSHH
jgi:cold shock protein